MKHLSFVFKRKIMIYISWRRAKEKSDFDGIELSYHEDQ